MENRPKVAVEIVVIKGVDVLLLERKFGDEWVWCLPGGHLEFSEEIIDCAKRELKEETNLDAKELEIKTWLNNIFLDEGKHYLSFILETKCVNEPKIMEPEKFRDIKWFSPNNFPNKLFPMLERLVSSGYFK